MPWQDYLPGMASSAVEGGFNLEAVKEANKFTKEMMQNKHQWQVADLEAAGLNRILSAGGNPPIGSSAQASISKPDFQTSKLVKTQEKLNTQLSAKAVAEKNSIEQAAAKLEQEAFSAKAQAQRDESVNAFLFAKDEKGNYANQEALMQYLFNAANLGINHPISRSLIEAEYAGKQIHRSIKNSVTSAHGSFQAWLNSRKLINKAKNESKQKPKYQSQKLRRARKAK